LPEPWLVATRACCVRRLTGAVGVGAHLAGGWARSENSIPSPSYTRTSRATSCRIFSHALGAPVPSSCDRSQSAPSAPHPLTLFVRSETASSGARRYSPASVTRRRNTVNRYPNLSNLLSSHPRASYPPQAVPHLRARGVPSAGAPARASRGQPRRDGAAVVGQQPSHALPQLSH
jgi:hypothetical protein